MGMSDLPTAEACSRSRHVARSIDGRLCGNTSLHKGIKTCTRLVLTLGYVAVCPHQPLPTRLTPLNVVKTPIVTRAQRSRGVPKRSVSFSGGFPMPQ